MSFPSGSNVCDKLNERIREIPIKQTVAGDVLTIKSATAGWLPFGYFFLLINISAQILINCLLSSTWSFKVIDKNAANIDSSKILVSGDRSVGLTVTVQDSLVSQADIAAKLFFIGL